MNDLPDAPAEVQEAYWRLWSEHARSHEDDSQGGEAARKRISREMEDLEHEYAGYRLRVFHPDDIEAMFSDDVKPLFEGGGAIADG